MFNDIFLKIFEEKKAPYSKKKLGKMDEGINIKDFSLKTFKFMKWQRFLTSMLLIIDFPRALFQNLFEHLKFSLANNIY